MCLLFCSPLSCHLSGPVLTSPSHLSFLANNWSWCFLPAEYGRWMTIYLVKSNDFCLFIKKKTHTLYHYPKVTLCFYILLNLDAFYQLLLSNESLHSLEETNCRRILSGPISIIFEWRLISFTCSMIFCILCCVTLQLNITV